MVGPIDKELLGKEAVIDKLEITTFDQARMIKEQEVELEVLQREVDEEEQTGIFDVKSERVETKSNGMRAMELEAQTFEAERARARQIWREKAIEAELAEAEDREWKAEIKGGEHVWLLEEKWWGFTTLIYSVDRMEGYPVTFGLNPF